MINRPDQSRRRFMASMLCGAGLTCAPKIVWSVVDNVANTPLLDALCDITIPDTDTPGAKKAGAPAFVLTAISHGLADCPDDALPRFKQALDNDAGADFLTLSQAHQRQLLTPIDEAAFSRRPQRELSADLLLWKPLKSLILTAYYTSEIGASQELRYVLVPGRFDPDAPCDETTRAFSSDWIGVKFG